MSSHNLEKAMNKITYEIKQQEETEHIFHYTNLVAVKGILESGCIWMTHAAYLNDTEEMRTGYKLFREMCEKSDYVALKNFSENLEGVLENSKFFVASFSAAPDMLSQWRGYCPPDAGYCIELEKDTNKSGYGGCMYKAEDKEKFFRELTNHSPKNEQDAHSHFSAVLRGVMLMKHEGFVEECEIRWAFPRQEDVEFRENKGALIPYIKQKINLNEIYAIWVGPGRNKELRRNSLKMYLDKLLKDGVLDYRPKVKLSEIPLR